MTRLSNSIVKTGLMAGSLDITGACTWAYLSAGTSPVIILKFVASGAFGSAAAFSGGWVMALAGLVFHFVIAFSWTIGFYLVYPHLTILSRNRILTGVLYGLLVWLVMNLLVLPMTLIPHRPLTLKSSVIGALILMIAIGMPISFRANKYYSTK